MHRRSDLSGRPLVLDRQPAEPDRHRRLRVARIAGTAERRHLARLHAGHDRRSAHCLAALSRPTQAQLFVESRHRAGLDIRARLSRHSAHRRCDPAHWFPVRLEHPHARLRADDVVIVSGFYGVWAYLRYPVLLSDNTGGKSRGEVYREVGELDKQLMRASRSRHGIQNTVASAIERTAVGGGARAQLTAPTPPRSCCPAADGREHGPAASRGLRRRAPRADLTPRAVGTAARDRQPARRARPPAAARAPDIQIRPCCGSGSTSMSPSPSPASRR